MRSEEVRNNMEYPPEFKKTLMTGRLIGAALELPDPYLAP